MAEPTTTPTPGVTTTPDPTVGLQTGTESNLSNWAGPYVTEMLGRGQALASQDYQGYGGPQQVNPLCRGKRFKAWLT